MAPILTKEEGLMYWERPARTLANRIRGLSPWPGVYTFLKDERWGIWKVQVEDQEPGVRHTARDISQAPGTITAVTKQAIRVQTGQGSLNLLEIQPENKKRMHVSDYLAGNRVALGMTFSMGKHDDLAV